MTWLDLNADLGEGVGDDRAMLAIVSSASIACGGHAGDEAGRRLQLAQGSRQLGGELHHLLHHTTARYTPDKKNSTTNSEGGGAGRGRKELSWMCSRNKQSP